VKASDGRVHIVRASDVIANATAQACRQAGLSEVCQELLGFDGAAIFFQAAPQLEGATFGDSVLAYEESCVIGIRAADGQTDLNPPMDTVFGPDDEVIAISQDEDKVIFTGIRDEPRPRSRQNHTSPSTRSASSWSAGTPSDPRCSQSSTPSCRAVRPRMSWSMTSSSRSVSWPSSSSRASPRSSSVRGDMDQLSTLLEKDRPAYDHVIILGYRNVMTPEEADARTFLTLLLLHEARLDNRAGRIVAEVLDPRDVELAHATGANDFIVSDGLSSSMIAQLTENPEVDAVFADLFDAAGSAIGVKPAHWYVRDENPVPFAQIVAAARARGEVAVGYRSAGPTGTTAVLRMNPAKSEAISLRSDDRVVVVGPPE